MRYSITEQVFHIKTECIGIIIERDTKKEKYYVDFGKWGSWCDENEIRYVDSSNIELINKGKSHD